MAFWGVEVKPGKPFVHAPNNGKRLHISQATLGTGSSLKNSVVQCNVGNSSPVFLCSLFPEKAEISQLHLEFEEIVEVVFSVIGPRSVHLTGYYLGGRSSQHFHPDDETESYGEDIADTETERSANGSDEDEYEDSFINDNDDPEIMSPSTVYSSEVEEISDKKKRKNGKGNHRRLRKKFLFSESEDEDKMPISFLHEREAAEKSMGSETDEKCEEEKVETNEKKVKDNGSWVTVSKGKVGAVLGVSKRQPDDHHSILPSSDMGSQNGATHRKREKHCKEEEPLEDDFFFRRALGQQKCMQNEVEDDKLGMDLPVSKEGQKTTNDKEDKVQDEAKVENTGQDLLLSKKENHKQANDDRAVLPWNANLPSAQLDPESVTKPKRKRKHANKKVLGAIKEHEGQEDDFKTESCDHELSVQDEHENGAEPKRKRKELVDRQILDTDIGSHDNAIKEEEGKQNEYKSDSLDRVVCLQEEQNQKEQSFVHAEKKKKKKRKNEERKKSKTQESVET